MKKTLFLTTIFIILLNQNFVLAETACEKILESKFTLDLTAGAGRMFLKGYNYAKNTNDEHDDLIIKEYFKLKCLVNKNISINEILETAAETNLSFSFYDEYLSNKTWTKQLGTSDWESGSGIMTDTTDNIFVVTNPFDGGALIKFNSSGTKQWTKNMGIGSDVTLLTLDSSDNIYVIGYTTKGLDGNTNLGKSDFFLIKYNPKGIKQWTQQWGTSLDDNGWAVTVDSSNNIYVTGQTEGGLDGNKNLGKNDIFLVKYKSNGNYDWTQQWGTSLDDKGWAVTVDSSDNIYVTGQTEGGLDGNTSSGDSDIFLVKYNSSGKKQWTKQLGTSSTDSGYNVTMDSLDNIYVTGETGGGLDGNKSSGDSDIFLVKYNSNGKKQWTKQLGTSSSDYGAGVTVDSSNNIYVTGGTSGGLEGNKSSGDSDIFLVKYNSNGKKQWTKQLGTSSSDYGLGVTLDSSNNIYVTGGTSGGLDGNTNSGGSDLFLVKYNSDGVKQ